MNFPLRPDPFLAERALFAQSAEALTEEFPDVFDGALCHGTVFLLMIATLTTFPWFRNRSRHLDAVDTV
jgi:hypothetical protein